MAKEIEMRCARLLKELRHKKGYTLNECEGLSGGTIKAVVLGSYERGTRAISLARLEQLAEFYHVPIEYFFTASNLMSNLDEGRLVFDLRRIKKIENLTPITAMVKSFLTMIAQQRSDWNGEVLSLRSTDGHLIAQLNERTLPDFFQHLLLEGFLFALETSVQRSL